MFSLMAYSLQKAIKTVVLDEGILFISANLDVDFPVSHFVRLVSFYIIVIEEDNVFIFTVFANWDYQVVVLIFRKLQYPSPSSDTQILIFRPFYLKFVIFDSFRALH